MTVDESNLVQNATGNFADNFSITSKFGADNAGTLTTDYKLSISAINADSGLDDVATGKNVLLTMNNGAVEGRVQGSNELVFTVSVNANGLVSLDGIRAVVHPNASNPDDSVTLISDTLVKLTRTDTIIDKDGDPATSSATLNIGQALIFKDDGPVAVDDCFTVSAPPLPSYNLTFVLDVSGSMNTLIGNTGKTRLDLLQEALTNPGALLDSYQAASTALKITIVTFSGDLDGQNADDANTSIEFSSVQAAKNYIDALSANGWTNYRAATEAAKADITADSNNPSLAGYIDRLYFLSDGKPEPQGTNGIDNRLTDAEESAWRTSLNSNNVEAFILNIGSISQSDVDEHLKDLDDDQPGTVITVAPDLSNLQQILIDTISQVETIGNVLTNDNAGADQGAQVINIYFTLATAQAANAYLAAHPELVGASINGATVTIPIPNVDIITPIGNLLHIESNGNFKYTSNFGPNAGQDEEFHYTMKDKDGDTATAELCFDIDGTVKISDLTPKAQGGDVVVDEDDLLSSRNDNESAGSDLIKETTNVQGSFKINAPDGVGSLQIADQTVISNDVFTAKHITSSLGNMLHILSYDAQTGTISYSYELKDNETHPSGNGENDIYEEFIITLKDADVSDPETATDVLTVRIIDDVPSITVTSNGAVDSLTVDETNLGQNASANFADNFSVASTPGADGATVSSKYVLTLSANGVDSGVDDVATGQNVMLFLNNGIVEGRTQSSNQIVFTINVDASGVVNLHQIRALVHPNQSNPDDSVTLNSADLVKLTRTDTILDSDGDSASSSATLNIGKAFIFKDDGPTAVQDTYVITPPPKPSYNLTFILDVSGSMTTKIGNTGKTRLDLLQEALTNNGALLDSYQAASTALKISIITFSGDLDGQNADDATISQEFSSIAAAKTYIDNLSANGWTNYRAAIQDATTDITQDSANPNLAGYIDRVYFLSDGKPQPNPLDDPGYSIDNRLTDAEESAWRTLLNTNNVEAFILNIGSFSQADIDEHLRDLDDDQPGTVITVAPDLSNLQQILVSTINQTETTGNVLTNDASGADSGKQLVNVYFTLASSQAATNYLAAHPELIGATRNGSVITIPVQNVDIITPVGNKLHIDANGAFTYSSSNYAQDDVINYTMKDKDGDTSSATLLFDLNGNASSLSAGQSVDGPIVDATIFQDENSNAILDSNESQTLSGAEGAYNLMIFDANKDGFIDSLDGRLVSIGGTDTATGLSYQIPLFAPVNSSIISPFTSLLEMQIEGNRDPKSVNDLLVKALGLTPGVDLTKLNPFISASQGEEQSLMQAAAIMTMSIQLGMALSQLLGADQAQFAEDIYKAIGDQILKSDDKADFSSVGLIHAVIEEVSSQLNVAPAALNPIVDMMKASQEAIQVSSHDILDPAMAISDVQSITQGAFAHAITDFYSGMISQSVLDAMINTLPQNVNTIDEHHNVASSATAEVVQEHQQITHGNILQDSQSEQHNILGYKYVNEANQVVEAEFGVSVTTKSGAILTIHQDGSYSISPSHPGESFMEVIEYTSVNKLGEQFENYLCLHTADIKPDYSQVADLFHQEDDNYIVDISHLESNLKISMQDIDTHHSELEQLHDPSFSNSAINADNSSQVAPSSTGPLSATVIVEQITAPTAVTHPLEQHTPTQTHE